MRSDFESRTALVHGQGCVRAARFDVLRCRRNEVEAFLYAFDLLELDGTDLRREPIETRKATLASVLPLAEGQDHAPQPGAGHRWRD